MRHHSIWKQNSWGLSPECPNRPTCLPLGESLISSFVFEAVMADACGFLTAQGVEPLNPHCSRVNVLLSMALSRRTNFSNHFLTDLVPWRHSPRTRNSPGLGTPAQALTLRRHQGGSMQVSKEVGGFAVLRGAFLYFWPQNYLCAWCTHLSPQPLVETHQTHGPATPLLRGHPPYLSGRQPLGKPTRHATSSQELLSSLRGFSGGFLSQEWSLVLHRLT